MDATTGVTPPPKIMLCLHPNCHGEFYLALDVNDWATCPHNDAHPVAIYSTPAIQRGGQQGRA